MSKQYMLGKNHSIIKIIPFQINQFEKRLSYSSHAEECDNIIFDRIVQEQRFLAFYVKNTKVLDVASINHNKKSDEIE